MSTATAPQVHPDTLKAIDGELDARLKSLEVEPGRFGAGRIDFANLRAQVVAVLTNAQPYVDTAGQIVPAIAPETAVLGNIIDVILQVNGLIPGGTAPASA